MAARVQPGVDSPSHPLVRGLPRAARCRGPPRGEDGLLDTNRQVREIAAPRGGAGSRMYRVGFAFRRGELRANGFRNGNATGLASHAVPSLPEGSGDSVLGAAGMPLFFLDIRSVEPMTTLGRWLAEPHLFLSVGASWNQDGPENHLRPATLSKAYDGLIFVDEGHAAKGLEAPHVSNY
ncbi:MAG TPA: erythromycin esterase family protein [Bryobacteraceae bacterium]